MNDENDERCEICGVESDFSICDDCYGERYCRICQQWDYDSTVIIDDPSEYGTHLECLPPLEQLARAAE